MRELKNQAIIAAIVTGAFALLVGFISGKARNQSNQMSQEVVVNLPDSQSESLSLQAAGDRIERLSREVATAESKIGLLEKELADNRRIGDELERCKSEHAACQSELSSKLLADPSSESEISAPGKPDLVPQERISKSFKFSLEGCNAEGSGVTCRLKITNTGEDRQLLLLARSVRWGTSTFLYDALGSEHSALEARLGRSGAPSSKAITDIAYEASFVFQGIPEESDFVAVLDVGFVVSGSGITRIKYRQIPIARE